MEETYSRLKPIVDSIPRTIYPSAVDVLINDEYLIHTCFTLWITPGRNVTIDGNVYEVIDISNNQWIKVKGSVAVPTVNFDIDPPFFWYGTTLAQVQQLNVIPFAENKLPMIWLKEITRERYDENTTTNLAVESDCELYFMVNANMQDWLTEQHFQYAIRPMRNLVSAFIEALRSNGDIGENLSYQILNHAKFGVYQPSKGEVKQLLNDRLSGCQLNISIKFLQQDFCLSDCNTTPGPPPVCADASIINSDDSYSATVPSGGTFILPDTTFNVYLDGVLQQSFTVPTLKNETINIS